MFALMEATLVIATVAQHFQLRMMPDQEIVPLASITLRPKNGVAMRLESRRGAKSDLNIPAVVVNGV
jgi:cytochrome P450